MDQITSNGFAFGKASSGKNSSDVLPSRFLPCKTFSDFISCQFKNVEQAVKFADSEIPLSMDIAIEETFKCRNNGDEEWRYCRSPAMERIKGEWKELDNDTSWYV